MKKHTGKIWRGLATTTASLLTITLGGSSIANARVDFINALSLAYTPGVAQPCLEPQATKSSREILTLMAFIMNLNLIM